MATDPIDWDAPAPGPTAQWSVPGPVALGLAAEASEAPPETPGEFSTRAWRYFRAAVEAKEPWTATGLALAVGLTRAEYATLARGAGELARMARAALGVVEYGYELTLADSGGKAAQFALQNLGEWADRKQIDFRGLSASLRLDRMAPEQLERIAAGEHPLQVLASGSSPEQDDGA